VEDGEFGTVTYDPADGWGEPIMGDERHHLLEEGARQDQAARAMNSRVAKAKELLAAGATYPKGCSGFVSSVLGIAWEDANSLMGASPTYVGVDNVYTGLVPGDVVGWKNSGGSGHVAIYVGETGEKFIDVKTENEKPRKVVNGYGGEKLYKSSKY
jgi:cell wall-associated NlpC family hydrolase